MENMTFCVLKLDRADQISLRRDFEAIGDAEEDPAHRDFVRALPDMMGLAASG
jgi:hypothetical protein